MDKKIKIEIVTTEMTDNIVDCEIIISYNDTKETMYHLWYNRELKLYCPLNKNFLEKRPDYDTIDYYIQRWAKNRIKSAERTIIEEQKAIETLSLIKNIEYQFDIE